MLLSGRTNIAMRPITITRMPLDGSSRQYRTRRRSSPWITVIPLSLLFFLHLAESTNVQVHNGDVENGGSKQSRDEVTNRAVSTSNDNEPGERNIPGRSSATDGEKSRSNETESATFSPEKVLVDLDKVKPESPISRLWVDNKAYITDEEAETLRKKKRKPVKPLTLTDKLPEVDSDDSQVPHAPSKSLDKINMVTRKLFERTDDESKRAKRDAGLAEISSYGGENRLRIARKSVKKDLSQLPEIQNPPMKRPTKYKKVVLGSSKFPTNVLKKIGPRLRTAAKRPTNPKQKPSSSVDYQRLKRTPNDDVDAIRKSSNIMRVIDYAKRKRNGFAKRSVPRSSRSGDETSDEDSSEEGNQGNDLELNFPKEHLIVDEKTGCGIAPEGPSRDGDNLDIPAADNFPGSAYGPPHGHFYPSFPRLSDMYADDFGSSDLATA